MVPRAEQEGEERDQAQVGQWAAVFDEVYGGEEYSEQDSEVNLRAWMNSYTRSPLPEAEIFCCFEDSVARIEALCSSRPSARLLEVGCGTGLLLLRIAPHCASYVGTDISGTALAALEPEGESPAARWSCGSVRRTTSAASRRILLTA